MQRLAGEDAGLSYLRFGGKSDWRCLLIFFSFNVCGDLGVPFTIEFREDFLHDARMRLRGSARLNILSKIEWPAAAGLKSVWANTGMTPGLRMRQAVRPPAQ
jgi:hypothetical protein